MLDDITFGWWWTGTNSQSSTSKALTWIQCKLGKQYLVKKFTLPSPSCGVVAVLILVSLLTLLVGLFFLYLFFAWWNKFSLS